MIDLDKQFTKEELQLLRQVVDKADDELQATLTICLETKNKLQKQKEEMFDLLQAIDQVISDL